MSDALNSWVELNKALKKMKEKECWALLKTEKEGSKRAPFLIRIFGRANKLRMERERNELLK